MNTLKQNKKLIIIIITSLTILCGGIIVSSCALTIKQLEKQLLDRTQVHATMLEILIHAPAASSDTSTQQLYNSIASTTSLLNSQHHHTIEGELQFYHRTHGQLRQINPGTIAAPRSNNDAITHNIAESVTLALNSGKPQVITCNDSKGNMSLAAFYPLKKKNICIVSTVPILGILRVCLVSELLLVFILFVIGLYGFTRLFQSFTRANEQLSANNKALASHNKELQQEKEELELHERKLKMIIDNSRDVELFINSNCEYEYISPSFETMTGHNPEALKSQEINVSKFILDEYHDAVDEMFHKTQKGESISNYDCKLIHKNGEVKHISISTTPVYDITNEFQGVRYCIRDISEKKKAMDKLMFSENQYRQLSFEQELILDNLPALAYYKDTNNCYIQVNRFVAEALGTSKEELVGKCLDEIYPLKLSSKYYADDLEVIKTKTSKLGIEEPWVTIAGLRWITTSKIPLLDEQNKVKGIIGLSLEITEQKEKELLLKTRDQHMKLITSNIPAIIYHVDENLTFIFANLEFETFTNKTNNNIVGKKIHDVLDDYAYASTYPYIQKALKGEVTSFENEMINAKGQKRIFKTTFVPEINKDNVVDGFFAMAIDLTTEVDYKRQLIQAKEKAEENDRLKTAFLSNISHEIRTPMNGILGFSQLLIKSKNNDEKRQMFIATIDESCQKLLSVINDIIEVSKIETGQIGITNEPSNINNVINDIQKKNIQYSIETGIAFKTHIGLPDSEAKIEVDKQKFEKIIDCLVSNAKKFTKSGSIELGYSLKGRFLEIFLKDTGIGIPDYMHDKIFDRFLQVERGMNRHYGGTGLGLSISRGYINLMGGKIWLVSEVGSGSTFFFTVPYKKIHDEEKKVIIDNSIEISSSKILVAEDEDINFKYIKEILEEINIEIIRAYNGQDAVDACNKIPDISLILMDIKMPIMDGYKATTIIKEQHPGIPVIAQTAFALSDDHSKITFHGFDDYISKPMNEPDLVNIINKHLKKSKT